jgi:hypothetical protein
MFLRNKSMTLVKSKINSLACLKSAIYISIVGGVILSSKPAASAGFTVTPQDDPAYLTISLLDFTFGDNDPQIIRHRGEHWNATFTITEQQGGFRGTDVLLLRGVVQHIFAPHAGDRPAGPLLEFDYRLVANLFGGSHTPPLERTPDGQHSGRNHLDSVKGILQANLTHGIAGDDISSWNFTMTATHVPEPLTIFGTATALGCGVLFKRKSSKKTVS